MFVKIEKKAESAVPLGSKYYICSVGGALRSPEIPPPEEEV